MIRITRHGDDPAIKLPALIRSGVWAEVIAAQTRLTRSAQRDGDLTDDADDLEYRVRVGGRSRNVEAWTDITNPPMPPYSTTTSGSKSTEDMCAAALFIASRYSREAPGSRNTPKNHSYRLRSSVHLFRNDKLVTSLTPQTVKADDGIGVVIIAPHASTIESVDHILARLTKIAQTQWVDLSISFGWESSEVFGTRFARGTGGPARGAAYALPVVTVRGFGKSVIGRRKRGMGKYARAKARAA